MLHPPTATAGPTREALPTCADPLPTVAFMGKVAVIGDCASAPLEPMARKSTDIKTTVCERLTRLPSGSPDVYPRTEIQFPVSPQGLKQKRSAGRAAKR